MAEGKCAIWGTPADCEANVIDGIQCSSKRTDGPYRIAGSLLASQKWIDLRPLQKVILTSWLIEQRRQGIEIPTINTFNFEDILQRKNLSTSKRVEFFFLYCLKIRARPGRPLYNFQPSQDRQSNIDILDQQIYAWTETIDYKEFLFLRQILLESNLIHGFAQFQGGRAEFDILTAKGFERLEEFEKANIASKQAFVAMWFHDSLNEVYEQAIEPAIREAGYEPRIIRKVEHNNKIDDEIIAEIRRSKFVIADFTCGFSKDKSEVIARGGVYYEAGFAQGLGHPVIWTCRSDIIAHVHFDTRQYNHIVWETATDLKEKLLNRIRATIT